MCKPIIFLITLTFFSTASVLYAEDECFVELFKHSGEITYTVGTFKKEKALKIQGYFITRYSNIFRKAVIYCRNSKNYQSVNKQRLSRLKLRA